MRYCVIKNTTIIIDGSKNLIEIMLQNALNSGYVEIDVEILTQEDYQIRKDLEPMTPKPITESERIAMIEEAINDLMMTIMMGGM